MATNVLYDAATGRPSRIDTTQGGAALLPLAYGFDSDGKILSIAENGGTRNFAYDETLQLTGGGYASAPESYAYDPEGNRTSSHLSATYLHDSANRLRETEDACYDYDANGNLISKTLRVGLTTCTGDVTSYEWDVLNRLVRIDFADGNYAAYRYDVQGRRIEKDVNGISKRYVYDGNNILLEFDGANELAARYSYGKKIDQPLAMTRGGQSYFYHTDHLGSVRLLTDDAGAIANRYNYDAFGTLEATSYETVANPFGFTARERDAESGLMFYRARYYDPKVGRFISEDPMGLAAGDHNIYRYVAGNPISLADPYGLALVGTMGHRAVVTGVSTGAGGAGMYGTGVQLIRTFAAIARLINMAAAANEEGEGEEEKADENAAENLRACIGHNSGGVLGRDEPENLAEQITLEEAMGGSGERIMEGKLNDPKFPEDCYGKMEHSHKMPDGKSVTVHYWKNLLTGERFGFKFK